MKLRQGIEIVAALAALAAGVFWSISARYGMTELPRIDASYDPSTPDMLARFARLRSSTVYNAWAAIAAAVSAFAQCIALWMRR